MRWWAANFLQTLKEILLSTSLLFPTIFIFSEMKRTRVDEDFNPVYPYNTEPTPSAPFVTPPFVSSNGLMESPSGVLSIRYTQPITVVNNSLSLKTGNGLSVSSDGKLQIAINTNKGLSNEDNKIAVKLGPELYFDADGAIAMNSQTLWTNPNETANCSVFQSLDSLLTLCLTKNGAHVLGSVSLTGLSGPLLKMTTTSVTVQLIFDSNGVLTTSQLNTNSWGMRANTNLNAPVTNALPFMPNSTIYARGNAGEPRSNYYVQTYLRGNLNKQITLSISFNASSSGYSLTFKWSAIATEKFATPTSSFCYIAEQ
uniref:Fiber-1 n=1 Tax=simian adenovirus 2 TaxID=38418 RepID=A0A679A5F7_9ADEN